MRRVRAEIRFPTIRRWEYASRDGITVSTYGMPSEFRRAYLNILVETRSYYQELFGNHTIGNVEFNVRKSQGAPLRLWTNGADRIFLTLSRKNQLKPASESGIRHLHGLTHELAHIVLYRSLINLSELAAGWGEGWAIFVASFLGVPNLWERHDEEAWPYPHPYLGSDGPYRYERLFAQRSWQPENAIERVVQDLSKWQLRIGKDNFCAFFRNLLATPIRADHFNAAVEREIRQHRKRKAA